jgi:hypothetical protein
MYKEKIMGMFDWIKKSKKKKSTSKDDDVDLVKTVAEKVTKEPVKTEKQLATERGEPWVAILSMDIDPENLHQGAFELDWNDKFIFNLIRAGYQLKKEDTDGEIVDRWFQNVCRHVVMETWEQEEAMKKSGIYVRATDIGGGRTEVS